jgi:hypothetical protein
MLRAISLGPTVRTPSGLGLEDFFRTAYVPPFNNNEGGLDRAKIIKSLQLTAI